MDVFKVFHECDPSQVGPDMALYINLTFTSFYDICFSRIMCSKPNQ